MRMHLRAAWRFRWLVLAGAYLAVMTPVVLLYHVQSLSHLRLVPRSKPSYIASTQVLVNNPTAPYLRANVTLTRIAAATSQGHSSKSATTPSAPSAPSSSSQTQSLIASTHSLVEAANLFPLF